MLPGGHGSRILLLAGLIVGRPALGAAAQSAPESGRGSRHQLELQAFLGSSVSLPSPVSISQSGQPTLNFTGHWATRPFLDTWYYAGRLGLWKGDKGWLLDFTHHKIYLIDRPAQVQRFQITHGMNAITVSRAFRHQHLSYAFGAGPLVAAPLSTVRGQHRPYGGGFFGGYYLAGGTLMSSVTRYFPLKVGVSLLLDGRASASYARVPVANGHGSLLNIALHFHAGLGWAPPF
jgi:hypothetical protein